MSSMNERISEASPALKPEVATPESAGIAFEFLAAERRNRLIGLWACEKMGLSGASIETYALALGKSTHASEEDVIRKILGDLTASRIVVREAEVRVKAAEFLAQSRESLKASS